MKNEKIYLLLVNDDVKEGLIEVLEDFKAWDCDYNKKMYPNTLSAFMVFAKGLPDSLATEMYYDEQRKYLSKFVDVSLFTNDEIETLYLTNIYNVLTNGLKEYNLGFWR